MEAEIGKDKLKIPFNTYDLFGYLIPGTVALITIYLFEFFLLNDQSQGKFNMPLFSVFNSVSKSVVSQKDWALSISFLVLVLIIIYVVGHIVSSVSSYCLDRVLINKGSGYPYLRLFGFHTREGQINWDTGPFYRGLFFWVNVYLIIRYYESITQRSWAHHTANYLGWFVTGFVLVKVAIGHFRRYPVRKLQAAASDRLKKYSLNALKYVFNLIFAGPYDLLTRMLSHYVNTRKPYSSEMIESYKASFEKRFKMKADTAESDNYWLCTCFVADKAPVLNSMIVNWLHMYSYARNIATAFYLAYLYCFVSILFQQDFIKTIHNRTLLGLPVLFFVLSLLMQSRYYYLYYSYYSKFLFRAFIYLNKVEK